MPIFLIPLLIIDWIIFSVIEEVTRDWSVGVQAIIRTIFWMIPIIVIGITYSFHTGAIANWNKRRFSLVRSTITLSYVSKVIILVALLLGGIGQMISFIIVEYVLGGHGNVPYEKTMLVEWGALILGGISFVVLLHGMIRNKYRYKIYETKVAVPNLPKELEGLKIVQISDIHSGSFTEIEPLHNAIELINNQHADLVFFTGDLVNSMAKEMEPFVDVFDKIKSRYGIFSILGNHDYGDYVQWESQAEKHQNFEKLKSVHQRLGWDLILNENRLLKIKGEEVAVIGVENYSAKRQFSNYGDLEKAYEGASQAGLKLLLSHDPSHWEDEVLEKFKDIHITFSGHTHGMQFGLEIPGLIKWSPIKYIYKQWAGLYEKNAQFLYVNRGFGFLGYPGRVGILPEITVMILEKK